MFLSHRLKSKLLLLEYTEVLLVLTTVLLSLLTGFFSKFL